MKEGKREKEGEGERERRKKVESTHLKNLPQHSRTVRNPTESLGRLFLAKKKKIWMGAKFFFMFFFSRKIINFNLILNLILFPICMKFFLNR